MNKGLIGMQSSTRRTLLGHEIGHAMNASPGGFIVTHGFEKNQAGLCYSETIAKDTHQQEDQILSTQDCAVVSHLLAGVMAERMLTCKRRDVSFAEFVSDSMNDRRALDIYIDSMDTYGGKTDLNSIHTIYKAASLTDLHQEIREYDKNTSLLQITQKLFKKVIHDDFARINALSDYHTKERSSLFFVGEYAGTSSDLYTKLKSMQGALVPMQKEVASTETLREMTTTLEGTLQTLSMARKWIDVKSKQGLALEQVSKIEKQWMQFIHLPAFTDPAISTSVMRAAEHLKAMQFSRIVAMMSLHEYVSKNVKNDVLIAIKAKLEHVLTATTKTSLWSELTACIKKACDVDMKIEKSHNLDSNKRPTEASAEDSAPSVIPSVMH
jgi:hypothetical protein